MTELPHRSIASGQDRNGLRRPPTYAFVLSAGHSGSTLLDLLLGAHHRIMSLGEITHLPKNFSLNTKCGCGLALQDCETWGRIFEEFERRTSINFRQDPYSLFLGFIRAHGVVDTEQQTRVELLRRAMVVGYTYLLRRLNLPVPSMPFRDMPEAVRNKARLFDTIADVSGAVVIVDSSKFYLDAIELYRRFPDQTRIILLTRDGRGVLYSGIKRGSDPARIIRSWRRTYARALPLLERHVPEAHRIHVRYEELTQQPSVVLRRICSFVGVEYEDQILDFGQKVTHITNGNRMRFSPDKTIRYDDAWSRNLSDDQIGLFEARAGALNRRLGYA